MALLTVHHYSETLEKQMAFTVILPQSRPDKGIVSGKTCGALYLLHGMSDDHTVWSRRTNIERYVAGKDLAVIMPNGDLSWYTDMKYGGKYYTYITQELRQVCHEFFPQISTRREDTFVAGNSMGGYGALKMALREPEVYSICIPFSGAFDIDVRYDLWKDREDHLITTVFGERETFRGGENDVFALAERLAADPSRPKPKIIQRCGTSDRLYGENLRMRDHLTALGFDLSYAESEGGHNWTYWDREIEKAIALLPLTLPK